MCGWTRFDTINGISLLTLADIFLNGLTATAVNVKSSDKFNSSLVLTHRQLSWIPQSLQLLSCQPGDLSLQCRTCTTDWWVHWGSRWHSDHSLYCHQYGSMRRLNHKKQFHRSSRKSSNCSPTESQLECVVSIVRSRIVVAAPQVMEAYVWHTLFGWHSCRYLHHQRFLHCILCNWSHLVERGVLECQWYQTTFVDHSFLHANH